MSTTKSIGGTPVLGSDAARISASKGRATPKGPTFGNVLASARPILKGAEAVASVLPGGPLVSAAVKAPQTMSGAGLGGPYAAKTGGVAMAPRIPLAPGGAPVGATPGVDPTGVAGTATETSNVEAMLAESQAFNLYYLQLQEEISAENRQYSALSNVLKARHDTVKNAIGNIR